ncbi:homocysteine S-methyltransferase family protein [Mahella sp.]|uniref:homocysteine S-methyltransferase family protein n=1 Tax=Mahella sp. TaxID=2798721 RepID=UPI0025B9FA7D|nr:homocysteine S-methyltransferase family protein [Mahella sp.]MBZ4666496.1 homocysteine S-methyltransferase [Mahella sp.]
MRKDFLPYLNEHFVIFDGAMGTMLQQKKAGVDKCPEELNIVDPDVIVSIHKAYKNAGSDVIETNTFGANALKLARWGLSAQADDINAAAAKLARDVMGDDGWVAVSVGPTGHLMRPFGDLSFDDAYNAFKSQILAATSAGADIICIETMSDINEARAAILAAKENAKLPITATMTFEANGRTLMGNDAVGAALALASAGADVVGINCSGGVEVAYEAIKQMADYSPVPLMAQPNAGMPYDQDGVAVYPLGPEEMLQWMNDFAEAGVAVLGGCCGTTPEHIKLLADKFKGRKRSSGVVPKMTNIISSGSKSVDVSRIESLYEINVAYDDPVSSVMNAVSEPADAIALDFTAWNGSESNVYDLLNEITSLCRVPLIFKNARYNVLAMLLRYYGGVAGIIGDADRALVDRYKAVIM